MKLWGRNKITKKYDLLNTFYDERQIYYMSDTVDISKYYEIMITDDSGTHCLFYCEIKDYTPYVEKHGKIKTRDKL